MSKPKVTFLVADDYEAMYVDGVLKTRGDGLTDGQILHALGREERSLMEVLGIKAKTIYASDHKALDNKLCVTGEILTEAEIDDLLRQDDTDEDEAE